MAKDKAQPKPKRASKPKLTLADMRAIIRMEPRDVVGFMRAKGHYLSWDWHEVLDHQHAAVFTVAKVAKLDVLQAIQGALIHAVEQGQTFAQFQTELEPILRKKGWWDTSTDPKKEGEPSADAVEKSDNAQYGSTRRLWTIYQTNLQSAFSAGRYRAMVEATDTHPFWRYVAIRDSRTRRDHATLDGRVYRFDDAFWQYFWPPNGYNCRCRVVPVSAAMMKREGWMAMDSVRELISVVEFQIGKGPLAKTTPVARFTTKDVDTGKKTVIATDPGFAYNVGMAAWLPEEGRWFGATAKAAQSLGM